MFRSLRKSTFLPAFSLAFASTLYVYHAQAADIYKANNISSFGQIGSFVTLDSGVYTPVTVLPGQLDTLVFDDLYTQTAGVSTGSTRKYYGLRVVNTGGDGTTPQTGTILISNGQAVNPVELYEGGIDLSNSARDLTINGLSIGASQTWNIGTGRTLTVGSTRLNNRTLSDSTIDTTPYLVTVIGSGQLTLSGTNLANQGLPGGLDITGVRVNSNAINNFGGAVTPVTIRSGAQAYLTGGGAAGYATNFTIEGTGWTNNGTETATGALRLGNNAKIVGTVTLAGNATITTAGSTGSITGVIQNNGTAHKLTIGQSSVSTNLTLTGDNTFTGDVELVRGVLTITHSNALGIGAKTVRVASADYPSLKLDGTAGNLTLASGLSFLLSSDGTSNTAGIHNLVGSNTIQGNISLINGNGGNGKVQVNEGTSLTFSGEINATGATSNRTFVFLVNGTGTGHLTGALVDGTSGRTLRLEKQNDGLLTISGTATNTYTGGTQVNNGTLALEGADNRLPTTGAVSLGQSSGTNGGTLRLGTGETGLNQTVASLGITSGNTSTENRVIGGATQISTLTLQDNGNRAFAGRFGGGSAVTLDDVSNNLSLIKAGTGTYTLRDNISTHVGDTIVRGGTLALASTASFTQSNITVETGATLDILGSTEKNVTLQNGASLKIGEVQNSSPFSGLAVIKGNLALAETSNVYFEIAGVNRGLSTASQGYDAIDNVANLTADGIFHVSLLSAGEYIPLAGDSFQLVQFSTFTDHGYSFNFLQADISTQGLAWNTHLFSTTGTISIVAAVPEPHRGLLLLLAVGSLVFRRHRFH